MANPYYFKRQDPTYNNSYYGAQTDQFRQSMPNQNAFSANGSFQGGVQNQSEGSKNWAGKQDWVGGVTAGLSAAQANGSPVGDFSIDPNAGYKGSFQGLASGGPIGAIVGGVGAQMKTFSQVNKNLNALNTGVDGTTFDVNGNPIYQGGNINTAYGNIGALNEGEKKIKRSLDPATRGFSGLYGTRKKIRRKRTELRQNIQKAQSDFNQSSMDARARESQMQEYYDSINNNNRLYNLYRNRY